MPNIGQRSAHMCPDCGQPMRWTESAVRNPDLLARTARGVESNALYFDAFRCSNGHISKECPLCGSFETAAWADSEDAPHYHVICVACGNDSVVQS